MNYLREATKQDMEMLYGWANEPTVRRNSFSENEIAFEDHVCWFEEMLQREDVKQYIFICDDIPVGQIRITVQGDDAEIDYSICLEKRCMGLGKEIIDRLGERMQKDFPQVKKLVAKVKAENIASQKVFLDTGFTEKYLCYERDISVNCQIKDWNLSHGGIASDK